MIRALKKDRTKIRIGIATKHDIYFSTRISEEIAISAQVQGAGIAVITAEYITKKIQEGNAVIAYTQDWEWVGFCYIEEWGHGKFVANSGLVVNPAYRGLGLAKSIKKKILELSQKKHPKAKIVGLTTALEVMKINYKLGYKSTTYHELIDDDRFWEGCKSCSNYSILQSNQRKKCLCTAMLYHPDKEGSIKDRKLNKVKELLQSSILSEKRLAN